METMGIETAIDAIETYKSLGDWRYADKEAVWKWMFEAGRKHAIAEAVQKDLWKARCLRMARALSAVMDRTHDHDIQAATGLPEGTIYVFSLVTYGYGETIKWGDLEAQKVALDEWAKAVCEKHNCSAEILVSANYW